MKFKYFFGIGIILLGIAILYGEIFSHNVEIISQTLVGFLILLYSGELLKQISQKQGKEKSK